MTVCCSLSRSGGRSADKSVPVSGYYPYRSPSTKRYVGSPLTVSLTRQQRSRPHSMLSSSRLGSRRCYLSNAYEPFIGPHIFMNQRPERAYTVPFGPKHWDVLRGLPHRFSAVTSSCARLKVLQLRHEPLHLGLIKRGRRAGWSRRFQENRTILKPR